MRIPFRFFSAVFLVFLILTVLYNIEDTGQTGQNETVSEPEVVVEDLEIPWGMKFLPDGDIILTERTGNLVRIGEDMERQQVEGVRHRGEGGLLGVALHPDFDTNRYIYLYMTTDAEQGLQNRVVRYEYRDDRLQNPEEIISGIPGASYHDGGRIKFGPDGLLYITTGDAGDSGTAQDRDSLSGKILRLEPDGSIPDGNPFDSPVYSYGHRNPQGITWDDEGNLWSTEHGRSGIRSGLDELNLVEEGLNYGWPVIQGDENREGMKPPEIHSGPDYTWAPASAEYFNGTIFFGGLRGSSVYASDVESEDLTPERFFEEEYGRIRTVRYYDEYIYFTTSNMDGRGNPDENDDRVLRVPVDYFG